MSAKVRIVGGVIAILAMAVFGQDSTKAVKAPREEPPAIDNTVKAINAVTINPLALIWGNINASYERFFNGKYGGMFQAGYFFKQGFGLAGHFRYHFYKNESHSGISSPFIGAFVEYDQTKDDGEVEGSGGAIVVYPMDVKYLKIGVNVGERWVLSNSWTIVGRIGYGFPVWADFKWDWKTTNISDPKSVENKKKYWNGVDAELSIGYAF